MADSLYELLSPHLDAPSKDASLPTPDEVTKKYLSRLSTLSLPSLKTSEPQSLAQSSHSNTLNIQSLSARSNSAIVASADHLSSLQTSLPKLTQHAETLKHDIPKLDERAVAFAEKYSRNAENEILDRRKGALLMARNVDRLSDILDLPMLLSSAIASSTAQGTSNSNNYAAVLDLYSHIKRLHLLYQDSAIINSVYAQTETAMQGMTSNLIMSLRSQNIKLAAAMRTIGWLKRVAPELDGSSNNLEGSVGGLFLVCRLATLMSMLAALDPLRDLADQESEIRSRDAKVSSAKPSADAWSGGQQTERYLKRYIEIFREQSFAVVSMYRSIFPAAPDSLPDDPNEVSLKLKSTGLKTAVPQTNKPKAEFQDPLNPLPSALATFPSHLVSLLVETLKRYLPNVRDKSSRESLLTQALYCAGSLGRLGGDFSLMLADLKDVQDEDEDEDDEDAEWVGIMKKHRVLAGKLEKLASGAG